MWWLWWITGLNDQWNSHASISRIILWWEIAKHQLTNTNAMENYCWPSNNLEPAQSTTGSEIAKDKWLMTCHLKSTSHALLWCTDPAAATILPFKPNFGTFHNILLHTSPALCTNLMTEIVTFCHSFTKWLQLAMLDFLQLMLLVFVVDCFYCDIMMLSVWTTEKSNHSTLNPTPHHPNFKNWQHCMLFCWLHCC